MFWKLKFPNYSWNCYRYLSPSLSIQTLLLRNVICRIFCFHFVLIMINAHTASTSDDVVALRFWNLMAIWFYQEGHVKILKGCLQMWVRVLQKDVCQNANLIYTHHKSLINLEYFNIQSNKLIWYEPLKYLSIKDLKANKK